MSRWGTQSKLSLEVHMWQHISHAWNFVVLATRITVLCLSEVESDMLLTLQFIWNWGRNISFGHLSKTKASQQQLITSTCYLPNEDVKSITAVSHKKAVYFCYSWTQLVPKPILSMCFLVLVDTLLKNTSIYET